MLGRMRLRTSASFFLLALTVFPLNARVLHDQRVAFEASYLPFPGTAADRQKTGDPRRSIAERYVNREDYLARYKAAVDDLVQQRWILPEDNSALLQRAEKEWTVSTE